MVTVKHA